MSRSSPAPLRVRACAKINLTLRVLGIRSDGYHELRTTFQSLALHDTLVFRPERGPFAISASDPACPADESNLVWKAAERVWKASGRRGRPAGVGVHIVKRIPVQAGLGGGSSDAAAALRALRALWAPALPDARLEAIGRSLGADIAFFMHGGTVLGVERGDLLFPLQDRARAWVVLARPDFGVSTRDAYGWWDEAHLRAGGAVHMRTSRGQGEWVNDLEPPVAARHPRVAQLIRKLKREGAHFAAMSGSGSAVFGLFATREAATLAAERIGNRNTATWLTRTTNRREYVRAGEPNRA